MVWYALPAFARGLAYSIRRRFRDVVPILVFAVTLTIAHALMQRNVGTAYRKRTQVTMFFFVFMAVGIVQRSRQATQQPFEPVLATAKAGIGTAAIVDYDFVCDELVGVSQRGLQASVKVDRGALPPDKGPGSSRRERPS